MLSVAAIILNLIISSPSTILAAGAQSPTERNQSVTPKETPDGVPIELRADLFTNSPNAMKLLDILVASIHEAGYRCDTISGLWVTDNVESEGYALSCNDRRLNYDVRKFGTHTRVDVLR